MATLQAINHDGPVIARHGKDGVVWTVQPEDFDSLVEHVNRYGGPTFWSIEPA